MHFQWFSNEKEKKDLYWEFLVILVICSLINQFTFDQKLKLILKQKKKNTISFEFFFLLKTFVASEYNIQPIKMILPWRHHQSLKKKKIPLDIKTW